MNLTLTNDTSPNWLSRPTWITWITWPTWANCKLKFFQSSPSFNHCDTATNSTNTNTNTDINTNYKYIFQHSTSSNCSDTSTNSFLDWPDISSPQDIDPDSVKWQKWWWWCWWWWWWWWWGWGQWWRWNPDIDSDSVRSPLSSVTILSIEKITIAQN